MNFCFVFENNCLVESGTREQVERYIFGLEFPAHRSLARAGLVTLIFIAGPNLDFFTLQQKFRKEDKIIFKEILISDFGFKMMDLILRVNSL